MVNAYYYDIKNEKLKKLVENKATELSIPVSRLIWRYISRGVMGDNNCESIFHYLHSKEILNRTDNALNVD